MSIRWNRKIERIKNHDLTRGVGQMILPPHDLADTHQGIIEGITKKESGCPIRPLNDEITDIIRLKPLGPSNPIFKRNGFTFRYAKS